MLFFRMIVVLLLLIVIPLGADLNPAPGSQYVFLGTGVRQFSLGFSGYSGLGGLESISFNPAAAGGLKRLANMMTLGGLGSDNTYIAAGVAIPTDSGVFSISGSFLNGSVTNSFGNLLNLSLGVSKPITDRLFWGFNIKGFRAEYDPAAWSAAFDMGILYMDPSSKKSGFGFLDFSWGLVLKGIGYPGSFGGFDEFPGMGLGTGVGFNLIKVKGYEMRLQGDITLTALPFTFSFNAGMEHTLFNLFKLRFGYALRNKSFGIPEVGPFTFGLGLSGKLMFKEPTDVDLSYAFVPQKFNGKRENTHFFNLTVAWGHYDSKKPKVRVRPHVSHFSPNYDGAQDKVKLMLRVKDNTMVDGWTVSVVNDQGKAVRVFKSLERLKIRSLNVSKFISRIFSKKRQVEIPKYVVWNGQNEKGHRVADGEYNVVLKAWDNNKNTASIKGTVVVDTVVPAVSGEAQYRIFSPNSDGARETVAFRLSPRFVSKGDSVTAAVVDGKGNTIRSYSFKDSVPGQISWDGKTDKKKSAPEGVYSLKLVASDIAGNKTENSVNGIRLIRKYEKAYIKANAQAFSPGSSGGNSTLVLKPSVSSREGLVGWKISIVDGNKKRVKRFTGNKVLPQDIIWDGRGDDKAYLKDGFYKFSLKLQFESGNHPVSLEQFIEVDRTPAVVKITSSYREFSPNGDGRRDVLRFTHVTTGHARDKITMRIVDSSGTEYLRKEFRKEAFPAVFNWKGQGRDGKPLPEGLYTYSIETVDKVGNRSRSEIAGIRLKTGLEKVSVRSGVSAISPGNKKAVSTAVFRAGVSGKTIKDIREYLLQITTRSGRVVKTFRSRKFLPLVKWDGRDDSGKRLPDGKYQYKLSVKYSFGDKPVSVKRFLVIDTKAPIIRVAAKERIFSPNKDGRKETLGINQKVSGDGQDRYTGVFYDRANRAVRSFRWKGTVPASLVWDGKDDKGRRLPEGRYSFVLSGKDVAGNTAVQKLSGIKLVRKIPALKFSAEKSLFSPNGDGKDDSMRFNCSVTSKEDLSTSTLTIYDIARRKVKRFQFSGTLPSGIIWDGKNNLGRIERDGIYEARLSLSYKNGNLVEKDISNIRLDARAPVGRLTVAPAIFTPDGDGENDSLFLSMGLRDFSGIRSWKMRIRKKGSKRDFRVFSGKGGSKRIKKIINWDGRSQDNRDEVEAVEEYAVFFDAVDVSGNRMKTIRRFFTVGVLVEKTPRGLRIRVSSIRFRSGSSRLKKRSNTKLNKVIYIIRRILSDPVKYGLSSKARIVISGHTDDVGPSRYNLKLSVKRARAVRDYMIRQDINPRILRYKGMGESQPHKIIRAGMSAYRIRDYRSRNRRVEFFILK